jgi:hypothetical protein
MAIAVGTNDLITVIRHLACCERFPKGEKQATHAQTNDPAGK